MWKTWKKVLNNAVVRQSNMRIFSLFMRFYYLETLMIDILRILIHIVKKAIKADVAPGEFKCRTCEVMWSSFRKNNSPCTDTTLIRNGLHDFDFSTPIIAQSK